MPGAGIPSSSRRHRNAAQSNIAWNNNRQSFDSHVKQLATTPGLNSGNQGRHAISNAALYFLGSLSSINNSAVTRSILPATSGDISNYPSATEVAYPVAIQPYVNKDYLVVNRDNIINMEYNYHETINTTEYISFIEKGRKLFTEFYENYNQQHPPLKTLARNILKERIKQDFQMDIDPDNLSFMRFTITGYGGDKTIQYGPPAETKSLTECLFTNFDSTVQDNLQDMDALCGIYNSTLVNRKSFNKAEAINIQPTKFIQTVWNIDFYEYAKAQYTDLFKDKNLHIKKLFLDFIHHLNLSQIDKNDIDDVLNAVGILNTHEVSAALFDINGYRAANAFVFTNESTGNVVLYFPESERKFFSFRSAFDMRLWVTNSCATEKHRKMISSHFTIANRQDGVVFYGIDAWLVFIDKNHRYYDKIARKPLFIPAKDFFDYLFKNIKDKFFSDLDTKVTSDAEVRRDIWENAIDATNNLLNPIAPFVSLAMHLTHLIDADTYDEEMLEWNKIKYDTINLLSMAALAKIIYTPSIEGYEFINSVKQSITAEDWSLIKNMRVSEYSIRRPLIEPGTSSLTEEWNFDQQMSSESTLQNNKLRSFLPFREAPASSNIHKINRLVYKYSRNIIKSDNMDMYTGFCIRISESGDDDSIPARYWPQRIANFRDKAYGGLEIAKQQLEKARTILTDEAYSQTVHDYLSSALATTDDDILKRTIARIKEQILRTIQFYYESKLKKFENIKFIIGNNPFSASEKNFLSRQPIAFSVDGDPLRRLFFFIDIYEAKEAEFRKLYPNAAADLESILKHEASHIAAYTNDFYYHPPTSESIFSIDAITSLKLFNEAIDTGVIKTSSEFDDFMQSAYAQLRISSPYNKNEALNILKNDPMMRVNMMLDNAPNFSIYTRDIANLGQNRIAKRSVDTNITRHNSFCLMLLFKASRIHIKKSNIISSSTETIVST